MAGRIKGITIEIDGSTVGLQKALSSVNAQANRLQSELRDTERLLKFNPGNIDLVAQKQKILTAQIEATRNKLNQLKSAQSQVEQQFASGKIGESQYRGFQREVINTEQKLRDLDGKLKTTNTELANNGRAAGKLSQDYKKAFDDAKKSSDNTFNSLKSAGSTVTVAGAGMAAGLGLVVKSAADFDQAMANAYSVMAPDEVNKFKGALQDLAIQMGAKTKYSATEAANGIGELLKAGVSVTDIMHGGLKGALDLATAGDLNLADAAQIASTALNAFKNDNLSVAQAGNILAGAANASATDVSELQFGLSAVSAVASGAGFTFKDTATALAEFAQNGLKGQDAGTSLKTMLLNLQPQSKAAANEMKQLGIITKSGSNEFVGANGKFKSLSDISQILQDRLKGLTLAQQQQALKTMFGTDAVRAANIMMHEGAKGATDMSTAMGKVTAADVAAQKMNTFSGAVEQLKGSLETAGISLGNALLPALKVVVQVVQSVIDGFNKLSPGMKSFIAIGAAVTAALLLLIGPILLLIGALPALMAGFTALAGPVGVIIGIVAAVIAVIVGLTVAFTTLYNRNQAFRNGVIAIWQSIQAAATVVWNAIINVIRQVMAAVLPFVMAIWNQIRAFWQQNGAMIMQATMNVWNVISTIIRTVMTIIMSIMRLIWPVIRVLIVSTWDAIKNTIQGAVTVIMSIIQIFAALFTGNWGKLWSGIKNLLSGSLQLIWGLINLFFVSKLLAPLRAFGGLAGGFIRGAWNLIKSIFMGALNGIRSFVTGGFSAYVRLARSGMSGISSIIRSVWNVIRSVFSGAINGIRGAVSGGFNVIRAIVSGVMGGIRGFISGVWSGIRGTISGAVNGARGAVSGAFNAMRSVVSSVMSGVRGAVSRGWNAAIGFLRGINLWNIGKNIIQGLVNGIGSMAGAVWDAVKRVAGGIKSKIMSMLGIHSPSKVMAWVGQMTGQGLVNGIAGMAGSVSSAAGQLAQAAVPSIPAVTAPSVTGSSAVDNSSLSGSNSAVVNLLQQQNDLLMKLLVKPSDVIIDKKAMESTVSRLQAQRLNQLAYMRG
ncbi:phage tail tape measure protein [Sporolactobacillus sp. CQH2019]|uniref:phage tail tape measure protein n=1 Tax=Sporolactobacillus sp. CQH2019 TaxID=3023512 RepID=UPI0023681841|nr:phage tail tape measure protein [Sporolactobacillus sp. CQH2019]MDD9148162.1 phage tail tape measure protein [Sporolactobacillus sp. CQH2019]